MFFSMSDYRRGFGLVTRFIDHLTHELGVFENRVLMRLFGPKRDEVTGGWSKLHNEELHNLYSSPSIIRMIKFILSEAPLHENTTQCEIIDTIFPRTCIAAVL
jgi:hypothetical protein